jgi:PKD repeat protein
MSSVQGQPGKQISLLFATLSMLFTLGSHGVAQDTPQSVPADDLPAQIRILSGIAPGSDYRWTLIGTNPKAHAQEALHTELNAIETIWHCPILKGRHAFKFVFTRPFKEGDHVFHLYVKADADADTGRKVKGAMGGVDFMLTLRDGASGRRNAWSHYSADGTSRQATHLTVLKKDVLYLSADMGIRQENDASVFDYMVISYVGKQTDKGFRAVASSNFGFKHAVSTPEPDIPIDSGDGSLVVNPGMKMVEDTVLGWHPLSGRAKLEAVFRTDTETKALVVDPLYSPEGLAQTVSLSPGHYLLRALAKTNVYQIHLFANRMRMPVAVSDEHEWVELPFHVLRGKTDAKRSALVGFRYMARPASGNASRLPAKLSVKEVELVHLGDTVLQDGWVEKLPADPLHGLKLINQSPTWDRPGKVVFQDTLIGTELWLMTQGGRNDHSYVGHPDFSHDGKYLHIGVRRTPRGLLRTDGATRFLDDKWGGLIWLFPWMQKRLPEGSDPSDWIVVSRNTKEVHLHNVVTRENHHLKLPSRAGWEIVCYPGIASYGGRGPRIAGIVQGTLVWVSADRKTIGLSTIEGDAFRAFDVRSISKQPEADTFHPSMASVGGKSGYNWRDALDRDGKRYFLFELNRDNLPNHPTNPYQVWALSMADGDERGPLRGLSHPNATVTEFVSSQTGMTKQPSAKWWDLVAGFPWSGDNGILRIEDETLVHMSSLGMHSAFFGGSTVSANCAYTKDVRFLGSFPKFDRVTWSHEFDRSQGFAVSTSHSEPVSPIVMMDLKHAALWTIAVSNFHDYTMRYKTRWNKDAYHKPMFRPAPTFSPDFTKVSYFSAMLTGDHPARKWADVYVAVVRYPQPPKNLRRQGNALMWQEPRRNAEIKGFRLYRSAESGRDYARVEKDLLRGTSHQLPADSEGCYVLTSVEHSGLESRVFSNEVRVGPEAPFRHFYQLEAGEITNPMVPFFEPAEANGAYAVAVTDPELVYKKRLEDGLTGSVTIQVQIPQPGSVRVLARVRGMSTLERASHTRGWPQTDDAPSGSFTLRINGKAAGNVPVSGPAWRWVRADAGTVEVGKGIVELELTTSDAGIAADSILVTDDPGFTPVGRGQTPEKLSAIPTRLRAETFGPEDAEILKAKTPRIKFVWDPVKAPQGVSHYNVYRGDGESFAATPENLLGSPAKAAFLDCGLEAGKTVYYRVRAVDAWGNQSPPSAVVALKATSPSVQATFKIRAESGPGKGTTYQFDAAASRTDAGQINSWQWTFGDGTSAQGTKTTHAYAAPGTYIVSLKIGNDHDEWATTEQSLYVPPGWIQDVLAKGASWVEAEAKSGEGGGESKLFSGRVNASGQALTYWQKDVGHWLEWNVTVPTAGSYCVALKYASGSSRVIRECRVDGECPGDDWKRVTFPETGGWSSNADNWSWRALQGSDGRPLQITLTAGKHQVRMANVEGGMALDAFMLIPFRVLPSSL